MAVARTEKEIERDNEKRRQRLKEISAELEAKFGPELGLAVFAYLHPEQWPSNEPEFDLRRAALVATLSTFATGEPQQVAKFIDVLIWLQERTDRKLAAEVRSRAISNAVY